MATASPSPFAVPPEAVPTKAELLAQAEARNMELEARNMDVAVARDKAQNAYRKAALRNKEQAQARSKAVAKARTKQVPRAKGKMDRGGAAARVPPAADRDARPWPRLDAVRHALVVEG